MLSLQGQLLATAGKTARKTWVQGLALDSPLTLSTLACQLLSTSVNFCQLLSPAVNHCHAFDDTLLHPSSVVRSYDNNIYCISLADGKLLWKVVTGGGGGGGATVRVGACGSVRCSMLELHLGSSLGSSPFALRVLPYVPLECLNPGFGCRL